jgi:hypothetical protein
MPAARTVEAGRCGVHRRCRCCRATCRDCSGACLPAARGLQLESGRAASRHRRWCRGLYSESHGAGADSTGCRTRKTCIVYVRAGQASRVRLVSIVGTQLGRWARAASRVTRRIERAGQVYIARQQRTCLHVQRCLVTHGTVCELRVAPSSRIRPSKLPARARPSFVRFMFLTKRPPPVRTSSPCKDTYVLPCSYHHSTVAFALQSLLSSSKSCHICILYHPSVCVKHRTLALAPSEPLPEQK